ncbi:hypothetical protein [Thermoactinospora rubra]|uniref:hypothetical protein n=1 Tax=Thermoactinospora rubra TaxID=1088767 RepID=UPI000A0F8E43|nr:hypothetical protein [Thermoactinospora rubra]
MTAGSTLRFLTEICAWVATLWALWPHSVALALLSVVVLIGLPAVFATPGDKRHVIVAVPGGVTVGLTILQIAAAVVAAWIAWIPLAAAAVTLVAAVTVSYELPRWRRLLSQPHP